MVLPESLKAETVITSEVIWLRTPLSSCGDAPTTGKGIMRVREDRALKLHTLPDHVRIGRSINRSAGKWRNHKGPTVAFSNSPFAARLFLHATVRKLMNPQKHIARH